MKVLYILKFDYTPQFNYWEEYKVDKIDTLDMLKASIESVKKHITNDIVVVSDKEIEGVKNVKLEGDPYHDRILIIHQMCNEFNDDILFVEHDVIFTKNPQINGMFFNVGLVNYEPFGEIMYFEKDKINEFIYIYIRKQQLTKRSYFEVPCRAALEAFKHFNARLGLGLVKYAYPLRHGGIIFKGSEDCIAIHNVAKTKLKNLKLPQ